MAEQQRTIFLTGGSRGIGAQLVRDAANAGFNVAFTYFNDSDAAEIVVKDAASANPDVTVQSYHLDVRSSEAVDAVVEQVLDDFDTVDIVVCNAGITQVGLMVSMTDDEWQSVLDTNLTGTFYVCRAFLTHFLGNRAGRFVHISSIAMHGMAGQVGYCASKAGLAGLSAAIAKEYGPKGITSNVIALGLFEGGMADSDAGERTTRFWKEFCPAGRAGDLSEIFRAVRFLGSEEAGFVSGEILHLAGGLNQTP